MDIVLLLYIPEFSDAFGSLLDFLLLHFPKLVFNLLLFEPLSLLNVINERSFETEFEYLRLSPDNIIEFIEVFLDLPSLIVVAFVNNIVKVSVSVNLVNFHSSIFDNLGEC